jgi:D-alanyl-D-alanine carboxypeptidase
MSKPLVATAAMLLMRDPQPPFKLDDKVCQHLPEVPGSWGRITIRHLLSHLSGIKEYLLIPDFSHRREYSDPELLNMVARYPLDFPPGDNFNYTNTGYCVLAMVIERTTKRAYGDILNERIFAPLGMRNTHVNDSMALIPGRASGYAMSFGQRVHADFVARTQLAFGDTGIVSTVDDLLILDNEMWNAKSKVLPRDMLEQMWTPAKLNNGEPYRWQGLGWGLYWDDTKGKVTEVYHGGAIEGFRSVIERFLDDQLTVVALFNGEMPDWKNDYFATDVADITATGKVVVDHAARAKKYKNRSAALRRR